MNSKRTLFIVDHYFPHVGGAEIVYQTVAEHLARQGWAVTVLTSAEVGRLKTTELNGVKVISAGSNRYFFTFLSIFKAWALARDVDVIQTATYNSAPAAWMAGFLRGKPVFLMVHELLNGLWFKTMNPVSAFLHWLFEKIILWLPFNRYIVFSGFVQNQLLNRTIKPEKITLIPHGSDTDLFKLPTTNCQPLTLREQLGYAPTDFILLFFGRLGILKGAEFLLQAMQKIDMPNVRLLMITPPSPSLDSERGIKGVSFLPSVPRAELPRYLAMADAIVIPSIQEGFGFSAAEACSAGRPVIASRAGALPETVFGRVIWTEPGDPNSIAEGIQKAVRGEWENIPPKHFSWEEALKKYDRLYDFFVGARHALSPKKIAIIADPVDEQYAGIHTYAKHLIEQLCQADRKSEYVFIHTKKNVFFSDKGKEIIIPLYRWFLGWRAFRHFILIPWRLHRERVDVVHELAHIAPWWLLPIKAKKIVTIHDLTPVIHPEWHPFCSGLLHRWLLPRVLRRANRIIAISQSTKRDIERIYHPSCPIFVTHLAAAEPRAATLTLQIPFLLHVGTIEPRKNLIFLLKVFECLKEKYRIPHHLYLIGKKGWKYHAFFQQLNQSRFREEVTWADHVPDGHLAAYYSQADAFILTSSYEGFGLPIAEAMQYGCPVVTGNHSSLPEVVGAGGKLAEAMRVECFAEAAKEVLDHRDEWREKALKQAQKFSWKKCAEATRVVYS